MAKAQSIVKKVSSTGWILPISIMCTNNKMHIKILCIGRKIHSDMDKLAELTCQFFVCYSNIFIVNMCKSEIIRNGLIGYLGFKSCIVHNKYTHKQN